MFTTGARCSTPEEFTPGRGASIVSRLSGGDIASPRTGQSLDMS